MLPLFLGYCLNHKQIAPHSGCLRRVFVVAVNI